MLSFFLLTVMAAPPHTPTHTPPAPAHTAPAPAPAHPTPAPTHTAPTHPAPTHTAPTHPAPTHTPTAPVHTAPAPTHTPHTPTAPTHTPTTPHHNPAPTHTPHTPTAPTHTPTTPHHNPAPTHTPHTPSHPTTPHHNPGQPHHNPAIPHNPMSPSNNKGGIKQVEYHKTKSQEWRKPHFAFSHAEWRKDIRRHTPKAARRGDNVNGNPIVNIKLNSDTRANYHTRFGHRFPAGHPLQGKFFYKGWKHHHWTKFHWSPTYGCYQYWCPWTLAWYYWCTPDCCFYPINYCPYGCYSCELTCDLNNDGQIIQSDDDWGEPDAADETIEETEDEE